MSIIPASFKNANVNSPSLWDSIKNSTDIHYIKNIQCISFNIFFELSGASYTATVLSNIPLRVFSCLNAYENKTYWKIAFDTASVVSLIFFGRIAAAAIDCASEVVNYLTCKYQTSIFNKDPLMVLGLTQEQAQNKDILEKRYKDLCREFDFRIARSVQSLPLQEKFKQLRADVESAYNLLAK